MGGETILWGSLFSVYYQLADVRFESVLFLVF